MKTLSRFDLADVPLLHVSMPRQRRAHAAARGRGEARTGLELAWISNGSCQRVRRKAVVRWRTCSHPFAYFDELKTRCTQPFADFTREQIAQKVTFVFHLQ